MHCNQRLRPFHPSEGSMNRHILFHIGHECVLLRMFYIVVHDSVIPMTRSCVKLETSKNTFITTGFWQQMTRKGDTSCEAFMVCDVQVLMILTD